VARTATVVGLLTEFRDEHKRITRNGRIALIGILASFLVSGATSILEMEKSKAEAVAHEREIRRLLRPFGDFQAQFSFTVPDDLPKSFRDELPQMRAYFSRLKEFFAKSVREGGHNLVFANKGRELRLPFSVFPNAQGTFRSQSFIPERLRSQFIVSVRYRVRKLLI
jgi:hypothetical protein